MVMSKAEIAKALMEKSGKNIAIGKEGNPSKAAANALVTDFFEIISEALVNGDSVRAIGFGSFSVTERKGRTGKNPRTKESIEIAPCKTVRFKVGKSLKESLNK